MKKEKRISASELKVHCAAVIDDVAQKRRPVLITKHGKPVARIVPIDSEHETLFGFAKGSLTILGDLLKPIDVEWEAGG